MHVVNHVLVQWVGHNVSIAESDVNRNPLNVPEHLAKS